MSSPEPPEPAAARRLRAVVHNLLTARRGRTTLGLGIFLLVLIAASRGGADVRAVPLAPSPDTLARAGFLQVRVSRPDQAPAVPGDAPATVAIDNLLSRYDALLRLLEAQAVDSADVKLDSAIAELRALRQQSFHAARTAVQRAGLAAIP